VEPQPAEERFRGLFQSARARVLAYALRRTATAEDAADVLAETFTIAWRRRDDLPGGDADILWLYATARRVMANDNRRNQHRAAEVARIGIEAAAAVIARQGSADHDTDAMTARAALTRRSENDREILMLTGWEGLGSAELADVLGCSPMAARLRLHRARARLTAELTVLGVPAKQDRDSRHLPPRQSVTNGVIEEP
jgi:RNA polymerase sigma-70 factor (ECF subfamily)